jgi:hypothetical protein
MIIKELLVSLSSLLARGDRKLASTLWFDLLCFVIRVSPVGRLAKTEDSPLSEGAAPGFPKVPPSPDLPPTRFRFTSGNSCFRTSIPKSSFIAQNVLGERPTKKKMDYKKKRTKSDDGEERKTVKK